MINGMSATPQAPTANHVDATGSIDYQVSYIATPQLQQWLRCDVHHAFLIRRTLETVYFDAEGLPLYESGAQLRERGRYGRSKRTTEAKVPTDAGLRRTTGDVALTAVAQLAGQRPLQAVATQVKHRELLLVAAHRFSLAPDFVVALDHATVHGMLTSKRHERCEIELQIFTALPWTSRVDDARVERFQDFCRSCEANFGLVPNQRNGYQAIPQELLT